MFILNSSLDVGIWFVQWIGTVWDIVTRTLLNGFELLDITGVCPGNSFKSLLLPLPALRLWVLAAG